MMNYSLRFIVPLLCGLMLLSSCSEENVDDFLQKIVKAPASSIERDVKGHEQIYSVQLILRLARKSPRKLDNGDDMYTAYGNGGNPTPVPLVQEIRLSRGEDGNVTITSDRKAFEVIKSEKYCYALELKYYDINEMLINYQFSGYDPNDEDNSTLLVHQHFFTVHHHSLTGKQLVYPMSLDSIYHNKYTFAEENGKRVPASRVSSANIYAPDDNNAEPIKYRLDLTEKSIEKSMKPSALEVYHDPVSQKDLRLYQAVNNFKLNEMVPELFKYEYRDTDPVEEELGKDLNDYDDMNRPRQGQVIRLRENRSLDDGTKLDALGFKGILRFKQSNLAFQMRICICHIMNRISIPSNPNKPGKYGKIQSSNIYGGVYDYNELQTVWNSFDIDYPIAFRVIANLDGDREQFLQDMLRSYPHADKAAIENMFLGNEEEYFKRTPKISF